MRVKTIHVLNRQWPMSKAMIERLTLVHALSLACSFRERLQAHGLHTTSPSTSRSASAVNVRDLRLRGLKSIKHPENDPSSMVGGSGRPTTCFESSYDRGRLPCLLDISVGASCCPNHARASDDMHSETEAVHVRGQRFRLPTYVRNVQQH